MSEIIGKTYDIEQAAEFIGCKPWKLRQLVKDKKIPHYRVGNRIRFTDLALSKWIQAQERTSCD